MTSPRCLVTVTTSRSSRTAATCPASSRTSGGRPDRGVMLSSLVERKRIQHAIRAMADARGRRLWWKGKLDVWGRGPLKRKLTLLIHKRNAPVKLRGYSTERGRRVQHSIVLAADQQCGSVRERPDREHGSRLHSHQLRHPVWPVRHHHARRRRLPRTQRRYRRLGAADPEHRRMSPDRPGAPSARPATVAPWSSTTNTSWSSGPNSWQGSPRGG